MSPKPVRHNQDGAVSVLFSVSLVVLLGAVAITVDAGMVWTERRSMSTAVESGALAAAQEYAEGGLGCPAVGLAYVDLNHDTASGVTCVGDTANGTVTVTGSSTVQHLFAPVLGRDNTTVPASATAFFGAATSASGLRPFGLCAANDGFLAWQASGHSTTQTFRISYGRDDLGACGDGGIAGNWGLIDFNGGSNSNSEARSWVQNGYPGSVTAPGWYEGDPGAFSNAHDVGSIVGEEIVLPVFDNATGNGANASFHIVGFVGAIVHGYKSNGKQADRYLDIQFITTVISGSCCDGGGAIDAGVSVVGLCRVDGEGSCP